MNPVRSDVGGNVVVLEILCGGLSLRRILLVLLRLGGGRLLFILASLQILLCLLKPKNTGQRIHPCLSVGRLDLVGYWCGGMA